MTVQQALTRVMEADGYQETRSEMRAVYDDFKSTEIENGVLSMSEPCSVCGREPTKTDLKNVRPDAQDTPVPYIVCPTDCVENLPEEPNTWTFETDGWQCSQHMPEVERRAAGFLGDHLIEVGSHYLSEDICEAAYTEQERAEIRQQIEALCRLVGYNAEKQEANRSLSPFFDNEGH